MTRQSGIALAYLAYTTHQIKAREILIMLMQSLEEANQIDRRELETLAAKRDNWCVTLHLPTHEQGKEVRQDPIRLKNRITDAEARLAELAVNDAGLQASLETLKELCNFESDENQEFWGHQGLGLAVLICGDSQRMFRLRTQPPEETYVGHRFSIRPLISAAQRDGEYGVIAVSRGDVRYFEGAKEGLTETAIDDLPESLQSIVGEEHQKGFGLHSFDIAGGGAGGEDAIPHGHVDKDEFEVLRRYFDEIVEALVEAQSAGSHPILFAGVTELFPYFKDAAEDRPLDVIPEPIAGNADHASADDLHEKAWPHIEKRLRELTDEKLERYRSKAHTDLTGDDLDEIVTAAHEGRIELLLIKSTNHPLGSYDPTQRRVVLSEANDKQGINCLDVAATKTLATDGEVLIVDDDQFDLNDQGVAAVYRYALSE